MHSEMVSLNNVFVCPCMHIMSVIVISKFVFESDTHVLQLY